MSTTLDEKGSSSKLFAIVMILFAVAGIGGVVYLASSSDSAPKNQQQSADVSLDGEPIAPYNSAAAEDPEIGKTFPTLTGESFDGTPITIEADGKPKAIYFLAHWCPHCQAEVKVIQELIDAGETPENLEILSVSTLLNQSPANYPPQEWLEDEDWTPPVLLDDEQSTLFRMLGGTGTPYVVYLDGNNTITNRTSGSTREQTLADWNTAETATVSAVESTPTTESEPAEDDESTTESDAAETGETTTTEDSQE